MIINTEVRKLLALMDYIGKKTKMHDREYREAKAEINELDKLFLDKAYSADNRVYFDEEARVLAVAGTSSLMDVFVDLTIPLGKLRCTERYGIAKEIFLNKKPTAMIGHSLGAAIVEGINDETPSFKKSGYTLRLYGAPR